MSALCETGRVPGRVDRNIEAGTAVYFPGGGAAEFKRVFSMTLKNAVTKGVKAWRDRRGGYWLCIDPKTGEYYLLTSAALAELNGLKVMYRIPAVCCRVVLTRNWNVKLGPHVIGTHLDTSAYITVIFMTFEEAKQQAIERSEWVLCHGAGYYTARTPDGRDIIGKGENGVFVGGL